MQYRWKNTNFEQFINYTNIIANRSVVATEYVFYVET